MKGLQPSAAREFMSRAGLACLLAYAPVLHGCGASADPANECAAATRMAIYFGSQDAGRLELSASERAAIGLVMPVTGDALCTGVVLPRGWVLTARHCDAGVPLLFGSSDASAGRIAVTSTKQHPEYDVMLLELADGGTSSGVTPISLWSGLIDQSWVGVPATLAGVGETQTGALGALRFVDEPVTSVDDIEIRVDGAGKSGACGGDSGGPLLVAAEDGSARVAGVLSRGSQSCVGIDAYTRVDRIREWVVAVIGSGRPSCGQ